MSVGFTRFKSLVKGFGGRTSDDSKRGFRQPKNPPKDITKRLLLQLKTPLQALARAQAMIGFGFACFGLSFIRLIGVLPLRVGHQNNHRFELAFLVES